MNYPSIRSHLKPYRMVARRKTTINHAFAAAVAPYDAYDAVKIQEAMRDLGQDPERALLCAYCGAPAQTWDHVRGTVQKSLFSGYGHRVGNLLPCCKSCNSAKGNKDWRTYAATLHGPGQRERTARIEAFLVKHSVKDEAPRESPEYKRLLAIKAEMLGLMAEADRLATIVRGEQI